MSITQCNLASVEASRWQESSQHKLRDHHHTTTRAPHTTSIAPTPPRRERANHELTPHTHTLPHTNAVLNTRVGQRSGNSKTRKTRRNACDAQTRAHAIPCGRPHNQRKGRGPHIVPTATRQSERAQLYVSHTHTHQQVDNFCSPVTN